MRQWMNCTPDERRVLAQIAFYGYANPHPDNAAILEHLTARGLVDVDTLTVTNPELEGFLRSQLASGKLDTPRGSPTSSIAARFLFFLGNSLQAVRALLSSGGCRTA